MSEKFDPVLREAMKEYQNRVKNAYISSNGMIRLGWNEIAPSSPFGQSLIKKHPHVKKLYS